MCNTHIKLSKASTYQNFIVPCALTSCVIVLNSFYFILQAVRAEISGFLQQLRFELTRKDFNKAALQCETLLSSRLENQAQVVKVKVNQSSAVGRCALVDGYAASLSALLV